MAIKNLDSQSDGIHDINITPFVDIVLVLLIVFMVSTPAMIYQGIRVALPKATTAEDISHVTLRFTLAKDGALYLDQKRITTKEVQNILSSLEARKVNVDALIAADKETAHGNVIELGDMLRAHGVGAVGLAASKASH